MPEPSTLQFDGALTDVSIQYANEEYIADAVLPPTPKPKKEGTYKVFDKDERFTVPNAYVGYKGDPREVEWNVSEATYACVDYGLQEFVSNDEIDNADAPLQPQSDTTKFVTDLLMLEQEKRTADFVFNASNYATANKNDEAGSWATLSTDVLTRLEAGIDACFLPPTILVMGIETWRKVARNEKILAAVKGTLAPQQLKTGSIGKPAVNQAELAEYLGLDAVLIGRARINTAKKGQTASYSRVWDGTNAGKGGAALLRVKPNIGTNEVVSAANFTWKTRQTFTFDDQRGARGGKTIRVVHTQVLKSVATDVGYLYQDCLVT